MKRRLWAPIVAVGLAAAILVPTTFAVGEPGTTLYAQLGTNRFPGGQGAADASLHFNGERDIVLRISIFGPAGTVNAVRVYVDGTCTNPGVWVINRTSNAGPNGPFLTVNSNSGVNTIQVNQLDVDRIREELDGNPNENFALMVARVINGMNYRTCTLFRSTPFPPLTTTTATTPTTSATGTNTTVFTTRTTVITTGGQTFTATITEPVTTSSLTTRTSTGFSTGTTVQTITSVATATTVTLGPTGALTTTGTNTSTGFSTGTSTFTSGTVTGTTTFTTPVTTSTVTSTGTISLGATTFTSSSLTTFTTTNVTTVPVTTVTLAL